MFKRIIISIVLFSCAGIFSSFAQENNNSDSLSRERDADLKPLLYDSLKLLQNLPDRLLPKLDFQGTESLNKQQAIGNNYEFNLNNVLIEPNIYIPPKFKPHSSFNLGASRWYMPVIGAVTTFSPTLSYQATKELSFFGGVSFSQFHNLSYVQSLYAPNRPAKSNIISNGFIGAEYRLFDRIMLHGIYQRSLYNQLPTNMIMFSPGQNTVITGASFDVWNGLGVTIDHVWEYDQYGNMRKGLRYSPYVDIQKFIKFLRQ